MVNENRGIRGMGSDPAEGTSHPLGEGVGAAAGAVAGGAAGAAAGPIGAVAGAAIGGIAGWLEGRTIAEGVEPQREIKYWGENYKSRPYYRKGLEWKDYEPAYTHGVYSYDPDEDDSDSDSDDFEEDWNELRGSSRLSADEARAASQDAVNRLRK